MRRAGPLEGDICKVRSEDGFDWGPQQTGRVGEERYFFWGNSLELSLEELGLVRSNGQVEVFRR